MNLWIESAPETHQNLQASEVTVVTPRLATLRVVMPTEEALVVTRRPETQGMLAVEVLPTSAVTLTIRAVLTLLATAAPAAPVLRSVATSTGRASTTTMMTGSSLATRTILTTSMVRHLFRVVLSVLVYVYVCITKQQSLSIPFFERFPTARNYPRSVLQRGYTSRPVNLSLEPASPLPLQALQRSSSLVLPFMSFTVVHGLDDTDEYDYDPYAGIDFDAIPELNQITQQATQGHEVEQPEGTGSQHQSVVGRSYRSYILRTSY